MVKDITISAAHLAERLHKGKVDKAGMDYFSGHLSAVAAMGRTWQEQVVGYLHDASEDCPYTVDEVLDLLDTELEPPLPDVEREDLATVLRLLNHHIVPDRETYIHLIGANALTTAVKLHDLTHNMDLSRLPNPTKKDFARVERYKKEYEYLSNPSK
ncbi:phosphohydrolase [Prevotella heparinolytica]|uniref:phosphohydrolase n=2 Tax=Bacteroides TaxID=816 RepID=UPI001F20FF45|nr:phosphohydrolase [Bacteroides heparinolyticus]